MTETENKISETIAELVPKLTKDQKEKFLCFAEGMVAMADMASTLARDQPQVS